MFQNKGGLSFVSTTQEWGLDKKVNSNGVAYADLDNDGDLDLVLNNQQEKASIYKNDQTNHFIINQLTLLSNTSNYYQRLNLLFLHFI